MGKKNIGISRKGSFHALILCFLLASLPGNATPSLAANGDDSPPPPIEESEKEPLECDGKPVDFSGGFSWELDASKISDSDGTLHSDPLEYGAYATAQAPTPNRAYTTVHKTVMNELENMVVPDNSNYTRYLFMGGARAVDRLAAWKADLLECDGTLDDHKSAFKKFSSEKFKELQNDMKYSRFGPWAEIYLNQKFRLLRYLSLYIFKFCKPREFECLRHPNRTEACVQVADAQLLNTVKGSNLGEPGDYKLEFSSKVTASTRCIYVEDPASDNYNSRDQAP